MDLKLLKKEADNPLYDSDQKYPYPLAYPIRDSTKLRMRAHDLAEGIPEQELYLLGPFLCCKSPESHIGPYRHAIDFLVPDGSIVYAADEGRVEIVQTGSNRWGPTPERSDDLNYITLAHTTWRTHHHFGPPEYHYRTQYCHLAKSSEREFDIKVGDWVRAGQPIARTGKTGWTDRDHLHFLAFTSDDGRGEFGIISLISRFK
ncbi:MAG: M23 family metallopeptidase [bacterium]